jgi:hypothetical protein
MATTRRTAVIGASIVLASAGVAGTAAAGTHAPSGLQHTHLNVHAPANTTGHYKATVGGKLKSHHTGVANESVSLQQRTGKGQSWTDTGITATTDADGKVSFTLTQSDKKEQYRLSFAGDSTYRKSHSGTVTVTRVKPAPTPTPTESATPDPSES